MWSLTTLQQALREAPDGLPQVSTFTLLLVFYLVGKQSLSFAYRLAWSFWRRAHQALARLCHYKRRSALASHLQL